MNKLTHQADHRLESDHILGVKIFINCHSQYKHQYAIFKINVCTYLTLA